MRPSGAASGNASPQCLYVTPVAWLNALARASGSRQRLKRSRKSGSVSARDATSHATSCAAEARREPLRASRPFAARPCSRASRRRRCAQARAAMGNQESIPEPTADDKRFLDEAIKEVRCNAGSRRRAARGTRATGDAALLRWRVRRVPAAEAGGVVPLARSARSCQKGRLPRAGRPSAPQRAADARLRGAPRRARACSRAASPWAPCWSWTAKLWAGERTRTCAACALCASPRHRACSCVPPARL